jgi:hypothetical protein
MPLLPMRGKALLLRSSTRKSIARPTPIGDKLDGDDLHPSTAQCAPCVRSRRAHLSFKLAAHELHVTPAAVGQQVKALEARLGVRLFERLHKQLVLTEAGQAYLPEISGGFRRIASADRKIEAGRRGAAAARRARQLRSAPPGAGAFRASPCRESACGCCSPQACTS